MHYKKAARSSGNHRERRPARARRNGEAGALQKWRRVHGDNVWRFKVDTRKDNKKSYAWGPDGSKKMEAWDMVMRALEAGSP